MVMVSTGKVGMMPRDTVAVMSWDMTRVRVMVMMARESANRGYLATAAVPGMSL